MSLQGTGTQSDPYIVSEYEDIKYILEQLRSSSASGDTMYLNLDKDIDCNKYGSSFEWSIQASKTHMQPFIFDLQGHTIKNALISKGGSLFSQSIDASRVYMSNTEKYTIMNGSLLNIFNNSAKNLADTVQFKNISISADLTNMTDVCIINNEFFGCSLYTKNSTVSSSTAIFKPPAISGDTNPFMKNTHVWIEWDNCNSYPLVDTSVYGKSYIDNCLISGYLNNKAKTTWNGAISASNIFFTSCVFDIMANEGVGNGGSDYTIFSSPQSGRGNIFNSTKWSNATGSTDFAITQEQMYSYSGLVSAGFPCARG